MPPPPGAGFAFFPGRAVADALASLAFRLAFSSSSRATLLALSASTARARTVVRTWSSAKSLPATDLVLSASARTSAATVAEAYCLRTPLPLDGSCSSFRSKRPIEAVETCEARIAFLRYSLFSERSASPDAIRLPPRLLPAPAAAAAPLPREVRPAACAASSRFRSSCLFCLERASRFLTARSSKGSTEPSSPGLAGISHEFIWSSALFALP
mmetsp:Transcript_28813/g.88349  ORF Transcript_28813/g.88349 Transcript_28813/m.88349 type:complete len:213 (+) Transcript_28813:491-1129(+)